MISKGSGARGRSVKSGRDQALGGDQPSGLTNDSPPSPDPALSNLLADLARAKASFQLRAIAAVMGLPPTTASEGRG